VNDSFVIFEAELSQQQSQGGINDSIQEVITNDMVASVSYCPGSEVSVSGAYG